MIETKLDNCKTLYQVVQIQSDSFEYNNSTCAIFENRADAEEEMEYLNQLYSENVKWANGKKYKEVEETTDEESYHYYKVVSISLNFSPTRWLNE